MFNLHSRPAKSYEEALERIVLLQRLDDERILEAARTRLAGTGKKAPLAVVLLHGFTNHPGQYREFAPMLVQRGYNVLIPRLPEHGDRDRMTKRLANLKPEALIETANEAIDIAQGLGERVVVTGISTSGLLCAFLAQYREDIARSIPVSPVFSMLRMNVPINALLNGALLALPNFFVWWDPRNKENELPRTGYPRFATHALSGALRIGYQVEKEARVHALRARSVVVVTNRKDPAVNNSVTNGVLRNWRAHAPGRVDAYEFTDLPVNHDIIDPENACPRTEIVYPKLLEYIDSTP